MSDETALLKSIVAHPDEDTPRLVYADWLDENKPDTVPSPAAGPSARAEFIRIQCRLAAGAFDEPDYPELLEREKDLAIWLSTHDPEPEPQVSGFNQFGMSDSEWADRRRGFQEVLDFENWGFSAEETVETLSEYLKDGFAQSPARSLALDDATPEEIAILTRHKIFKQVRGLHLDFISGEETEAIAAIADSPQSVGLRRLFLDLDVGEEACRALAESPHLWNLESLVIDYPISARSLKRFHGVKWFRNLRRLHLRGGRGDILGTLAEFPKMPRLVSLALNGGGKQSRAAVRRFAVSDSFPCLAYLELSSTLLGPDHISQLATAKWPLRHLVMDYGVVRKAGCEAIAAAPFAKKLRVLSLGGSDVTAGGVQALADSPSLAGLRHLYLGGNPIGPGGLAALAASKNLTGLRSLNLGNTNHTRGPIAARHVVEFLSLLDMPELRHLCLDGLPVAVRGARVLATVPTFANLTRLQLQQCGLGNAGTSALAESITLSNLAYLDLFGNKVGSGAGKLANPKVFPKLGHCRLGHGVPKKTVWRLNRRPGIVV